MIRGYGDDSTGEREQLMKKREWWQCPNCGAMYPNRCKCDCGSKRPMEKMGPMRNEAVHPVIRDIVNQIGGMNGRA